MCGIFLFGTSSSRRATSAASSSQVISESFVEDFILLVGVADVIDARLVYLRLGFSLKCMPILSFCIAICFLSDI